MLHKRLPLPEGMIKGDLTILVFLPQGLCVGCVWYSPMRKLLFNESLWRWPLQRDLVDQIPTLSQLVTFSGSNLSPTELLDVLLMFIGGDQRVCALLRDCGGCQVICQQGNVAYSPNPLPCYPWPEILNRWQIRTRVAAFKK